MTNYGEIFCLWLDGADDGTKEDGKYQEYDYDRIFELARKLQPNILLANGGPDVRWVGNEDARTRRSEWSVVPACVCPAIAKKYRGNTPAPTQMDADLGSRELLDKYEEYLWYPAEVDYSIHKGWFYHPWQMPRSLNNLYSAYMRTVGGNGLFLLNIPPDKKGRIVSRDVRRLLSLKKKIDKTFSGKIEGKVTSGEGYLITLPHISSVRTVVLKEDVDYSQRVESFSLCFLVGEKTVEKHVGTVIGFSTFVRLKKPIRCDKVLLNINECRGEKAYISTFELYE